MEFLSGCSCLALSSYRKLQCSNDSRCCAAVSTRGRRLLHEFCTSNFYSKYHDGSIPLIRHTILTRYHGCTHTAPFVLQSIKGDVEIESTEKSVHLNAIGSKSVKNARNSLKSQRHFDTENPDDCWGSSCGAGNGDTANSARDFDRVDTFHHAEHCFAKQISIDETKKCDYVGTEDSYEIDDEGIKNDAANLFGTKDEFDRFKRNWYQHSKAHHNSSYYHQHYNTGYFRSQDNFSCAPNVDFSSSTADQNRAIAAFKMAMHIAHQQPVSIEEESSLMNEIEMRIQEASNASSNNLIIFGLALGIELPDNVTVPPEDKLWKNYTSNEDSLKHFKKSILLSFHPDKLRHANCLVQHMGSCIIKAVNQMNQN